MKNNNLEIKLLGLFILFFSVFIFPQTTSAITISPVRFELSGDKGQTLTEEILILNERDVPETYYFSFQNFEAQGETGSPAFVEAKDGLGSWMSADRSSVTILPGEQITVPFKIKIPEDAESGGHFGVVFLGNNPPGDSSGVSVGAQTGSLVLLSVSGDVVEDAGLLSFGKKDNKFFYKTLPVTFEYRFKNDGGDRIKPQGKINIRNALFIRADKFDANPSEGNVLPGSIRKYSVDWHKFKVPMSYLPFENYFNRFFENVSYQWKNFAVGLYSANLKLEYGKELEKISKTTFFFVFPWELVLIMVIVILSVFFGGRFGIKKYNNYIIRKARESNIIGGNS